MRYKKIDKKLNEREVLTKKIVKDLFKEMIEDKNDYFNEEFFTKKQTKEIKEELKKLIKDFDHVDFENNMIRFQEDKKNDGRKYWKQLDNLIDWRCGVEGYWLEDNWVDEVML